MSTGQYILESCPVGFLMKRSTQECGEWISTNYIVLAVTLGMSQDDFNSSKQKMFRALVAIALFVDVDRIMIASATTQRRLMNPSVQIKTFIETENTSVSVQVAAMIQSNLPPSLESGGFQHSKLEYTLVLASNSKGESNTMLVGIIVGCAGLLCIAICVGYVALVAMKKQGAQKLFLAAIHSAKPGQKAGQEYLPLELRNDYIAHTVLGMGAFGCVIMAEKRKMGSFAATGSFSKKHWSDISGSFTLKNAGEVKHGTGSSHMNVTNQQSAPRHLQIAKRVAIKIVIPKGSCFDDKELRQLRREEAVLDLLTIAKCENAVHLAGVDAVCVQPSICWFVMELLDGDSVEAVISNTLLEDAECVILSRHVLSALKVMHADGLVHRDIKPANVMRCTPRDGPGHVYKLIDFGTSLGVDESLAKEEMMTLGSGRQMGAGTPPYMSPEMFREPEKAGYPTDLWSLGVTVFEAASGSLPFQADSDLLWSVAVAGNMDIAVPSLLDALGEGRRAGFDNNLAKVVAKALEKWISERYAHNFKLNCHCQ
jgi:serine/threonine protein kinase